MLHATPVGEQLRYAARAWLRQAVKIIPCSPSCFGNNFEVQVRLLVGPAGSGKTVRCLTEARQALLSEPEGPPLILLAPKQGTYQLEQQCLSDPSLAGYTRLHIVSFESLAHLLLDWLQKPSPQLLDEEGRLMVLRNLLATRRHKLKLFRASARLTGFAEQLSLALHDLQSQCLTPAGVNELAQRVQHVEGLAYKLQDLATLFEGYLDWVKTHKLQDADWLLSAAAEALRDMQQTQGALFRADTHGSAENLEPSPQREPLLLGSLWVDGFAQFSLQELALIEALLPVCQQAALTFCLPRRPGTSASWLSPWALIGKSYDRCRKRFAALSGVELVVEHLSGDPSASRFSGNPVLAHLEQHWGESAPFAGSASCIGPSQTANNLRIVCCPSPEDEVRFAAREILKFVRSGGRFRDISVLVRNLEGYYQLVQRVFSRYEIPFFLDRREPIAHHPLAELTRSALRTVAFGWQHEDWFAVLKSGLVAKEERDIDRLENEALARGWKGSLWRQPLRLREDTSTAEELERVRRQERELEALRLAIIGPFESFAQGLAAAGDNLTGPLLASAIRDLWDSLDVQDRLETWAEAEPFTYESLARGSVHQTVWKQCLTWLENLELAFRTEALSLGEWLPILEAGLASLTVGSVPPALDQVLVGAVDRSRTPEIKLALVLGMNETLFPASPTASLLLSDTDRLELEKVNIELGASSRRQLGFERYLAYIACTRARVRLVLTCALNDARGAPLNPSPFLSHLTQLFPSLQLEKAAPGSDLLDSQHAHELVGPLLKAAALQPTPAGNRRTAFGIQLPELDALLDRLGRYQNPQLDDSLAPPLAEELYGPILRTSVSRMEEFAACPFKFFVHSGLRAEERRLFELDPKEQGTFQHDVLARFHQELRTERKRWRDITPQQARARIKQIAQNLLASFRGGLLEATEQSRFAAGVLTDAVQDFVEILVEWMQHQYLFDPVEVELPFGQDVGSPPWSIDLGDGHQLEIRGRIDRVDLYRAPEAAEALGVVIDYKSGQKDLDPVLMEHGLQLQLLTYLNVLRRWPNPHALFGINRLVPAGVFYVNLRGSYPRQANRLDALGQTDQARKLAYRHTGRFDANALPQLDARARADQFNYRLTASGRIHGNCREALKSEEFKKLLDQLQASLESMGRQIYSGVASVSPFRKGAATACDRCGYGAICRIDPWTHRFRVLKRGS